MAEKLSGNTFFVVVRHLDAISSFVFYQVVCLFIDRINRSAFFL